MSTLRPVNAVSEDDFVYVPDKGEINTNQQKIQQIANECISLRKELSEAKTEITNQRSIANQEKERADRAMRAAESSAASAAAVAAKLDEMIKVAQQMSVPNPKHSMTKLPKQEEPKNLKEAITESIDQTFNPLLAAHNPICGAAKTGAGLAIAMSAPMAGPAAPLVLATGISVYFVNALGSACGIISRITGEKIRDPQEITDLFSKYY